jgi:hypothetical protein
MSNNPIQSRVADWISSSNPHPITLTWTRTSSLPVATITQTDYITSTIVASESVPTSTLSDIPYDAYAEDLWEERIHRFLPVILAFAIIGVLTVLGSLVYLAYRFYQANRASRQRRLQKAEQQDEEGNSSEKQISPLSTTLSHIIPWLGIQSPNESCYHPQQREPIRFEKSDLRRIIHDTPSTRRPSLAASWLAKLLPTRRHMSLPILLNSSSGSSGNPMDNLNVPISSTFVPIQTSSLTLVPRSEIWQDPHRRRGVDEVDMWERKQSGTEILTIAVPEEEGVQILQSQSTPQQPMWKFTQHQEAYPDSPDSFQERRFSLPLRRSMEEQQLESHRSSTATVLDSMTLPSTSTMNKPSTSQRKVRNVWKGRSKTVCIYLRQ